MEEFKNEYGDIRKYDKNNNLIYYKNYIYENCICEYWYDSNGNIIHCKNSNGCEYYKEYDENNNKIHYYDNSGHEEIWKYDKNNNKIYYRDSLGCEEFWGYDENNRLIYYKNNQCEKRYEYNSNGKKHRRFICINGEWFREIKYSDII